MKRQSREVDTMGKSVEERSKRGPPDFPNDPVSGRLDSRLHRMKR